MLHNIVPILNNPSFVAISSPYVDSTCSVNNTLLNGVFSGFGPATCVFIFKTKHCPEGPIAPIAEGCLWTCFPLLSTFVNSTGSE